MQTTIEIGQLVKPRMDGSFAMPAVFKKYLKLNKRPTLKIMMIGDSLVISPYAKKAQIDNDLEMYSDQEIKNILKEDREFK